MASRWVTTWIARWVTSRGNSTGTETWFTTRTRRWTQRWISTWYFTWHTRKIAARKNIRRAARYRTRMKIWITTGMSCRLTTWSISRTTRGIFTWFAEWSVVCKLLGFENGLPLSNTGKLVGWNRSPSTRTWPLSLKWLRTAVSELNQCHSEVFRWLHDEIYWLLAGTIIHPKHAHC